MRAFQALGDKNQIARVNNLLSWVYTQQGNYAESVILNFATLKVYEEQGDTDGIAIVSANIAEDYLNLEIILKR
ncbi:MAG: hypothetical protein U0073_03900 [Bacteroidia bacterium]